MEELVVLIWFRDGQDPEKTDGAAWLFVALKVAMGIKLWAWRGGDSQRRSDVVGSLTVYAFKASILFSCKVI